MLTIEYHQTLSELFDFLITLKKTTTYNFLVCVNCAIHFSNAPKIPIAYSKQLLCKHILSIAKKNNFHIIMSHIERLFANTRAVVVVAR